MSDRARSHALIEATSVLACAQIVIQSDARKAELKIVSCHTTAKDRIRVEFLRTRLL